MTQSNQKTTAYFVLLDAQGKPLKNIEYWVSEVKNGKDVHIVTGKTNSKGETYKFIRQVGIKIWLHIKVGNDTNYRKANHLILPAISTPDLKIRAKINAVLLQSKLVRHGQEAGKIKRKDYKVVKGDTLDGIAYKFNTQRAVLLELNPHIKAPKFTIREGEWLKVPIQSGDVNKEIGTSSSGSSKGKITTDTYTVQAGDTLSEIALRSGRSVSELQRINGISNRHQIFKGQVLKINSSQANSSQKSTPNQSVSKTEDKPWYDKALSTAGELFGDAKERVAEGYEVAVEKTTDGIEYVANIFGDDESESSASKSSEKPNPSAKKEETPIQIKTESGRNQNGNHTEQVSYDSDTTVYHIYHDGRIERANRQAVGFAQFIYYDEDGNKHYLGKTEYIKIDRWGG